MSFSYTYGTDNARVRFMIADTVDDGHIVEDEEILMALQGTNSSIPLAAAACLRAIAANKAKLEQKLKVLDIDMDTRGLAAEYRALAKDIEKRADDDGSFAFAEIAPAPFGTQERLEKERQRQGV